MLVSVIIPVFNSAKTIRRSVESVVVSLERETKDYEIICIDDGSADDSLQVLSDLSLNNPKIIVVHQDNAGAAVARNKGLEVAKGDLIAFNDSDDEWIPEHFFILKNTLINNPELYCIAGNYGVDQQKTFFLKELDKDVYLVSLKKELIKNYYSPPATMFKRDIIERGIRFNVRMRYAEEGFFFYQIVHAYPCGFVNKRVSQSILGKEKFGESGLSGNLKMMEKGELSNLKFAYKKLGINFLYYTIMVLLSYIKYFRRIIITKCRA